MNKMLRLVHDLQGNELTTFPRPWRLHSRIDHKIQAANLHAISGSLQGASCQEGGSKGLRKGLIRRQEWECVR